MPLVNWPSAASTAAAITDPDVVNGANRTHRGSKRSSCWSSVAPATPSSSSPCAGSARCSRATRRSRASASGSPSSAKLSSLSFAALAVPISTFARPSSWWIGDDVSSTARTLSSWAVRTLRLSSPRWSSMCVAVIRNRVVRKRMTPRPIGIATPIACHSSPLAELPSTKMPISTGRNLISSLTGCTSSIRASRRRHSASRGTGGADDFLGRVGHVASPASASVRRVRSATSRSATSLSIALIVNGPAADAVVTVTEARPSTRPTADCS